MDNKQIINLWNGGKIELTDYRTLNGEIIFIFNHKNMIYNNSNSKLR